MNRTKYSIIFQQGRYGRDLMPTRRCCSRSPHAASIISYLGNSQPNDCGKDGDGLLERDAY